MFMTDDISDTVQASTEAIRQTAENLYNAARSDGRMTVPAIQAAIAKAYADAQTKMAALQEKQSGQATARRAANLKAAFGNPSNDPTAAISARDAADRAAQLGPEDYSTAADLLERAERNGDGALAAAVGYRAYELTAAGGASGFGYGSEGWSEVLSSYLQSRPQAAAALNDLMASTVKPYIAGLTAFMLPVPSELASLSPWQITALAAS